MSNMTYPGDWSHRVQYSTNCSVQQVSLM